MHMYREQDAPDTIPMQCCTGQCNQGRMCPARNAGHASSELLEDDDIGAVRGLPAWPTVVTAAVSLASIAATVILATRVGAL